MCENIPQASKATVPQVASSAQAVLLVTFCLQVTGEATNAVQGAGKH